MPNQIPFPGGGELPPHRRPKVLDEIIDHLFQVLPADSTTEILSRLNRRGLNISMGMLRKAICQLRKNASEYLWTIPHVCGGKDTEMKYFGVLVEKDQHFHTDPACKANLLAGTSAIVTRISTETSNQDTMLQAAASATYLSRALREELNELAEECTSIHRKAKRVLRYLKKTSDGTNGN